MTLYFDCFSGISGDMTLAALLDLGIDNNLFISELNKLSLGGWRIEFARVSKHGIGAQQVKVILEEEEEHHHHADHHSHHHHHRTLTDIVQLIDNSAITPRAKELAKRIFHRLAIAEAKIHGTTPDKVHFHEVGAVDSIIDIVGTAICIDILSPDRVTASVLRDGYGSTHCQHGMIPIPAPAVVEVLAAKDILLKQTEIEGELITPTGAAIIAELSEHFGVMPEMQVNKIGYGAGTKDFPSLPNLLRVIQGESTEKPNSDQIMVIETNIDDSTPEVLSYTMGKLLEQGAKDVFFTPIYMKKGRPATLLTVLCAEADAARMENILFTETSTIGLRKYMVERTCLPRETVTLSTQYGEVKAKQSKFGATKRVAVEYDDACRLARENNVPLQDIYRIIFY